jgi:hypothetical protein
MATGFTPLTVIPAMIVIAAESARTGQNLWSFFDMTRTGPPQ